MILSPNGKNGWDAFNTLGSNREERDLLTELLAVETLACNRDRGNGEPEDLTDLPELLEVPSNDWDSQQLFPELHGIAQQPERDTRTSYHEYEVHMSQFTQRIPVGGGEEVCVTEVVQRSTIRWQRATSEFKCRIQNGEALSHSDTATATCGFVRRRRATPSLTTGDAGHLSVGRPVGDIRVIGLGKYDASLDCDLDVCCDMSGDGRDYGRRWSLELAESDSKFYDELLKTMSENSSGCDANCSVIDQDTLNDFRNAELFSV